MTSLKTVTLGRLLALGLLVCATLLTLPPAATACPAADLWECWDNCFVGTFEACLNDTCGELTGPEYSACRSECWGLYKDCIRDCNAFCPW